MALNREEIIRCLEWHMPVYVIASKSSYESKYYWKGLAFDNEGEAKIKAKELSKVRKKHVTSGPLVWVNHLCIRISGVGPVRIVMEYGTHPQSFYYRMRLEDIAEKLYAPVRARS